MTKALTDNETATVAQRRDLSIIIVTYNSASYIRNCLGSLIEHAPQISHGVVVVDNDSSDDTVSIVEREFPEVELLKLQENIGFGRGNNAGMEHRPAEFYYLHNADAYLQGDSLDQAVELMRKHDRIAIGGLPLVYPDSSPQTAAYAASTPRKWLIQATGLIPLARNVIQRKPHGVLARLVGRSSLGRSFAATYGNSGDTQPSIKKFDWVCGAAMVIRDSALADLDGGFDPAIFLYGEDEDLCLRASECGWEVAQLQTVPVVHEFGWGKSVKSTRVVVDHKLKGLSIMIDRHFKTKPVSRIVMHALLRLKHIGWSMSARRG